jgi:RimJ/RimL family protein N-acetyltransferase
VEVRRLRVGEGARLLRTGVPLPGDPEALAAGPGAVLVAEAGGACMGIAGVRPREDGAERWLTWSRDERAADALAAATREWARLRALAHLDGEPLDPPDRTMRTERLLLRPFEDGDLHAIHAMRSREDVVRWLYEEPSTLDEDRERLGRRIHNVRFAVTGDGIALAVAHDGTVVGDCSLTLDSAEHHQGEVGFIVHPDHQGRGYATEAARAMLELGFGGFGLHRITGRVEARNAPSARVLERLGMRREAHLVENELVKGEWQSEMVYAILAREWRQSQPRRRK